MSHHNIRVAGMLRDALEFGTLEQCLSVSLQCHELECAGHDLSITEERLWLRLTEKIERLKNPANEGVWNAIYR